MSPMRPHTTLAQRPAFCAGPRSSAVVGGYTFLHEQLEEALADLKQTEDCLLFPTGFAANVAVVSALCSSNDVTIFSDELNHASIIDGARLASRQQVPTVLQTALIIAVPQYALQDKFLS